MLFLDSPLKFVNWYFLQIALKQKERIFTGRVDGFEIAIKTD